MSIVNADIFIGDARVILPTLPDRSVQAVITSPPYFAKRDYGTAEWQGGDEACDHAPNRSNRTERRRAKLSGSLSYVSQQEPAYRSSCRKCGAIRVDSQIGLEQTVDEYIGSLLHIFRLVRNVLRDDGTMWLNLGDSFSKKNLLLVPSRVALQLQQEGWTLRQDIIWEKTNAMPESVKDRLAQSYEHVFFFAKTDRYFFNEQDSYVLAKSKETGLRKMRDVWSMSTASYTGNHFATFPTELARRCIALSTKKGDVVLDPFAGSGTTVAVANRMKRKGVAIELNPNYESMILDRLNSGS